MEKIIVMHKLLIFLNNIIFLVDQLNVFRRLNYYSFYKLLIKAMIDTRLVVYPTISPTLVLFLTIFFSGITILAPGFSFG